MTNQEKWNLIVDRHAKLYGELESKVQNEWELYCSDLFEYKKLLNEIDAQRHLTVGSGGAIIPDIILRINDKDIFDIELKQYSLSFDPSFETQLISYLNMTHLSVGMIVCSKIYLYYYEYATITVKKIEIPFKKDDPDGIALMGLLLKDTFSAEHIREYIDQKETKEQRIKEIRGTISKDWLRSLVLAELSKQYSEEEINAAIGDYSFTVTAGTKKPAPINPSPVNPAPVNPTPRRPVMPANNILGMIRNWCSEKANEGIIGFEPGFSTQKLTRYTTPEMDEVIPYHTGLRSGWSNGHYYAFEIVNQTPDSYFYIWIAVSNKNAPSDVQETFSRMFAATGKYPKKDNWDWWTNFSTKKYRYSDETTEEEVHRALDEMFDEINAKVQMMINAMQ